MALLAGHTAAFQAPKPTTKPKGSLDVSFVDRFSDIKQPDTVFAPVEESSVDRISDIKQPDTVFAPVEESPVDRFWSVEETFQDLGKFYGGMTGKTDLEKRLQKGVAFRQEITSSSTQPVAAVEQESPVMKQEQSVSSALASALDASEPEVSNQEELSASSYQEQYASVSKELAGALDLSKVSNVLSPTEAFEALVQKGEYNAASSTIKILFSSALGGCYVGMGAMVSLAVAGNSPDLAAADPGLQKFIFAALFPMNLLLAQQCGGMLYTGNTANMMAAFCERRVTLEDIGRVLSLSWIGNLFGCSLFALACKYAGVMEGGAGVLAATTLVTKTSSELGPVLVKAMFCNWLVCLAVLLSTQAKDMGGKYISIWLPVSTFVSIGFEHSVANMFLLPAGLLSQHDITFPTALVKNLIPVSFGNAISGSLLVGATMSYLFGSLGKQEEKK